MFQENKKAKENNSAKDLCSTKMPSHVHKYRQHEFVMDDESYFTLSNTTLTGNNTYYYSDRRLTPADVSYWEKAKFEEKLLLWIVVSSKGIGQVYIAPSKQAINQHVYLKKCIKKRLVPFINKYHSGDLHIMRIQSKTGLESKASAFWQKKTMI